MVHEGLNSWRGHLVLLLGGCLLASGIACSGDHTEGPPRKVSASTIKLELPKRLGHAQRPPVEFDHDAHTTELGPKSCESCHELDDEKRVIAKFKGITKDLDRDGLLERYHDGCLSCHNERNDANKSSGPLTCGECHSERRPGTSAREVMAFDYSLHFRHARTMGEKCESCHHVFDEEQDKLVYKKGAEEACSSCHAASPEHKAKPEDLLLSEASHKMCISCHLERSVEGVATGPGQCSGCHDAGKQQALAKVKRADIPRLQREQPDRVWMHAEGAQSKLVAFDHEAHEHRAEFCSSCHHATDEPHVIKPCKDCHTLTGSAKGGGVTLEQAFHLTTSTRSCVGCHQTATRKKDCAGCHATLKLTSDRQACAICHSGPAPNEPRPKHPPKLVPANLAPLPTASRDTFPKTIMIELLADTYGASKFDHLKIVKHMDALVRKSGLASHFHGSTDMLCAGCHHNSPVGSRPPPCSSCHDLRRSNGDGTPLHYAATGDDVLDKPDLMAAYHRQCIGCHEQMVIELERLEPKQPCTECHRTASKEGSR